MPQLQDFQFFQVDRLNEIYEKEQAYELHKHTNNQKEAAARAQVCLISLCQHFCSVLPFYFILGVLGYLMHVLPARDHHLLVPSSNCNQ